MIEHAPFQHVILELPHSHLAERMERTERPQVVVMVVGMDPATVATLIQEQLVLHDVTPHADIIISTRHDDPYVHDRGWPRAMEALVVEQSRRLSELMAKQLTKSMEPIREQREKGWYRRFEKRRLR